MRWIIFIGIYIVLDIYAFQAFKTVTRQSWVYYVYLFFSLVVLANLIYQFNVPEQDGLTGARS